MLPGLTLKSSERQRESSNRHLVAKVKASFFFFFVMKHLKIFPHGGKFGDFELLDEKIT